MVRAHVQLNITQTIKFHKAANNELPMKKKYPWVYITPGINIAKNIKIVTPADRKVNQKQMHIFKTTQMLSCYKSMQCLSTFSTIMHFKKFEIKQGTLEIKSNWLTSRRLHEPSWHTHLWLAHWLQLVRESPNLVVIC